MSIIDKLVSEINKYVFQFDWFDFEVYRYENNNLVIIGSTDFSYYHQLEIHLSDVMYYSGALSWGSNAKEDVVQLNRDSQFLVANKIYDNLSTLEFKTDDETMITISFNNAEICTDTVFYYLRDNLNENERIADWVQEKASQTPKS